MKIDRPSVRLQKWIEEQVAALAPGALLPTDSEIASAWGLSRRTVGTLMRRFASEGKIIRIAGKGTFLPGGKIEPGLVKGPVRNSAEVLRDNILTSVSRGEFKVGDALPSIKYMSRKFKVSPKTVIAAYKVLIDEKFAVRVGKNVWLGEFHRLAYQYGKKEVCLILRDQGDLDLVFRSAPFALVYRKFEDVLSSAGFMVRVDYADNFKTIYRSWLRSESMPFGVIYHRFSEKYLEKVLPELGDLTKNKARQNVRVVIDWDMGYSASLPKNICLLSRPNMATTAARTLARFLLEKRYLQTAFFIDARDIYDEAQSALWSVSNFMRVRAELKNLNQNFDFRLVIVNARGARRISSLTDVLDPATGSRLLSKYQPTQMETVRQECVCVNTPDEGFVESRNREVWLFQRDHHAAAAVDWARSNHRKVPEDISLISLQNDPGYFHLGLTRCESDWDGIGYLMAHAVIGDIHIEKTSKGFIRTSAKMIEKLTTR